MPCAEEERILTSIMWVPNLNVKIMAKNVLKNHKKCIQTSAMASIQNI